VADVVLPSGWRGHRFPLDAGIIERSQQESRNFEPKSDDARKSW
jgi:hypothetical protein